MDKSLLILSLGKPGSKGYEEVQYRMPDGREYASKYISEALLHFCKPDEVIIIGTADSVWDDMFEAFYSGDPKLPHREAADRAYERML